MDWVTFGDIVANPKAYQHLLGWCIVNFTAKGFGFPVDGMERSLTVSIRSIDKTGVLYDSPMGKTGIRSSGGFVIAQPESGAPRCSNLKIRKATETEYQGLRTY